MSESKVVQLHLDENGLPYMDFNDINDLNSNNINKSFGIPKEIPDSKKTAIGRAKEEEILKNTLILMKKK